jgi:glycosyl hydrolase family 123
MLLLALLVFVAGESEKIRPDAQPKVEPQAPRVRLIAAGGDCAGAQIVVQGPAQGLTAAASEGLDLYRIATIALKFPSGPEGSTGDWPDALIPARDAVYQEPRRAFPVDVPARKLQSIFVEACLQRGAGRLRRSGWVKLSWNGGSLEVPVEIRGRAFDLPATPDFVTTFGFSGYAAARGHGRKPEAGPELTRAYDLVALRRGITLMGGRQDAPPFDGTRVDWKEYDAEVAPFLDGTALPSGARWTSVDLREPGKLSREARRTYRRAWVAHFRERGWLDRLFRYVIDEPPAKDFGKVEALAREYLEDVPEVRRLVTTAFTGDLPSVDLFTPVINCVGSRNPTCDRAAPRSSYRTLWWYQSCLSHGCSSDGKPITDKAFSGWPSYMIDAPATAGRAMGTLAFVNEVPGELYYDTVYAYEQQEPWSDQWAFGGNGDGTLFYPGTPERIGGKHDVPVESLRLLQIARSIADYGYLSLCARLGDRPLALAEARAVTPSIRGFSRDPPAYAQMREHLAARIESLLAAGKGQLH